MLRRLSEPLKQFLGFVGGISASLATVFSAAGFLAVRAHLVTLGLPSTTFDLQQYLEVGARFVAYLPIFLGIAVVSLLLDGLAGAMGVLATHPVLALIVAGLGIGVLAWRRWRSDRGTDGRTEATLSAWIDEQARALYTRTAALFENALEQPAWLAVFLFLQFLGAYQLTQVLEIHNLLFANPTAAQIPHVTLSLVGTDTLVTWIRDRETVRASQYLGWLFLITMLTAWGLHRVLRGYRRRSDREPRTWQLTWLAASLLLFVTQITLLPVNYGVLLSSNLFAEVSLTYRASPPEERPADARLALLHETGGGYYLYAPSEKKIWYILREDVRTIRYHGMVHVLDARPETRHEDTAAIGPTVMSGISGARPRAQPHNEN